MTTNTNAYRLFVGIDRSDTNLNIACLDGDGNTTLQKKISTKPEALLEWVNALRSAHPGGQIAVCIEQPCANIASFLGQFDFIGPFLINPFLSERYRKLQPWRPASAQIRQLRAFLEHRRPPAVS